LRPLAGQEHGAKRGGEVNESMLERFRGGLSSCFDSLSLGGWVICALAVLSSLVIALWSIPHPKGLVFWTFAKTHKRMYDPMTEVWNKAQEQADRVHILLLSGNALQRRLLSGFLSNTPVPDLVEAYAQIVAQTFKGPLEDVGFVDLTDRLHDEGIYEQINTPSFAPWTSRGHIFGLPHDVHPVLLAYRADIVEAAGIDVANIETWDDFVRLLRPLVRDIDGDGYVDRYLLNIWETNPELLEVLILQAGGALFDASERLVLNSEINARVLATVVSWTTGPDRIAVNAPEFDAAGNKMRLDGTVVCSFMPDWLTGAWRQDLPQLAGKVKLMPLPAWEPGGRRTSVMGGTMLGIPKRTQDFTSAWQYAKNLYLSKDLARALFRTTGIISPVKRHWTDPMYDQPSAYFSGQRSGRLYIAEAPEVPPRTSSPYNALARTKMGDGALELKAFARRYGKYTVEELLPEARRQLAQAAALVRQQMRRNVFLTRESR
jgi:arabinosaccharide transport system substrate-binding protein